MRKKIPVGYTKMYNVADLKAMKNNPKGKYYLANDITLTKEDLRDGSIVAGIFSGIFDGNGHTLWVPPMSKIEIKKLNDKRSKEKGGVITGCFSRGNANESCLDVVTQTSRQYFDTDEIWTVLEYLAKKLDEIIRRQDED